MNTNPMTSSSTQSTTLNPSSLSIPQEAIPDPAAVYAHEMFTLVNHEDIINILQTQEDM
jgi:hypothetical protein